MSKEKSLRVLENVNPKVKVGDKVKILDYSYISDVEDNMEVFNLHTKYDAAEVMEIGVTDRIYISSIGNLKRQDVVFKLGGRLYRGQSGFLKIVRTPEEVVAKRIDKAQKELAEAIRNDVDLIARGKLEDHIEFLVDLLNEIKLSK